MLGKDAQVDDVLCMGSGGAAAAISLVLFERGARRLTLTDRNPERLAHARALHAAVPHAATEVEYVLVDDGGTHDRLLARLRPGALVVNATGLGKDRPGTPLGAGAAWPEAAVAWELNYRGELEFLAQARAAGVRAEDGWRYFIFGWTAVMELVFQRPIGAGDIERLAEAAAFARPGGTT
jgi:shikimate 5-dehydrogenase